MIKSILLKNFKCFKNQEIKLSNLTLLSGVNGMGKSTTIQSLLLLRQTYEANLLDKGLLLNGEFINIGIGKDLLNRDAEGPEIISIQLEYEDQSIEYEFKYSTKSDFLYRNNKNNNEKFNNFKNDFEYICAERIGPRSIYNKSYSEVKSNYRLGINGEYTEHFLLENGDEKVSNELALNEKNINNTVKEQVKSWLDEITPGVGFEIEDYENADSVGLRYRIKGEVINEFRPINVGFGITYVLPILVALLKAREGSILIIENPEAHLHPRGQRKIGELIAKVASGGVQVILETHSDHILNGIRLSVKKGILNDNEVELHFFDRNENDVTFIESPKIKKDGRLTYWPKGFFDEWDYALDELF